MKMARACTHQTDEDEDKLDDICVSHRVKSPQQCVDYGHYSRDEDGVDVGQIQDYPHSSTWNNRSTGGLTDVSHSCYTHTCSFIRDVFKTQSYR